MLNAFVSGGDEEEEEASGGAEEEPVSSGFFRLVLVPEVVLRAVVESPTSTFVDETLLAKVPAAAGTGLGNVKQLSSERSTGDEAVLATVPAATGTGLGNVKQLSSERSTGDEAVSCGALVLVIFGQSSC